MKKPQASDFVMDVMDTRVNVVFTPNGNPYMFGRLVDPDDVAHYGPVSRTMGTGVGENGGVRRGRSSGDGSCAGDTGGRHVSELVICGAARPEHPSARQGLV